VLWAGTPLPVCFNQENSNYFNSLIVLLFRQITGFWVVHSFPKFPNPVSSGYDGVPDGELIYAQSVLCVSVAQSGLDAIGGQLQLNRPGSWYFSIRIYV
jgi:deoxyribonuclease-2